MTTDKRLLTLLSSFLGWRHEETSAGGLRGTAGEAERAGESRVQTQGCATVIHTDFKGPEVTSSDMSSQHPPKTIMAKDYEQLWKGATGVVDKVRAVQTLGEILADPEGRVFVSRLDGKGAELCIEILDQVSRDLYLPFHYLI